MESLVSETSTPLAVGQHAPQFSLADAAGKQVSLSDYAGKNVVVYFYPKAATPGCTTEACDFRDNLNSMRAAGYEVLGISPDQGEALTSFTEAEELNFPLLSDPDFAVAKAYGSYGDKEFNGKTFSGTLRSTVVINGDGVISHAEYNVAADGHVARLRESLGI
ncbi:thioredoxin-dependent thiol peroxidase [Paeniglutamicibacter gangotriensis]|uniref:thioredoxin-dependent peroxiredoxin n=2 Tax=Paeniglutamicibacter gangotriensis TaxID=254787 RepID=M7NP55_9MICC|nr:thioredoxin-dependent thiol peroxidase [Paeniglutamicibacter gangotriensis]EMR00279.1 alkyl hydroperoxide reductase [Paeniglutamicibacter gangotriensis Lz1y]KAA0979314.1 thioredoxin-dependent thiol peroxidase [Paeniglutamicibacter gangotriensis]